MKKIQNVLTIVAVLFSATFSFAQVSIGAKAGVYTSFIDVTDAAEGLTQNVEGLTTPTFGIVAEIGLGENFAFQPELLYTTKGFKIFDYVDENDGQGVIEVLLNGEVIETITLDADDGGNGRYHTAISSDIV